MLQFSFAFIFPFSKTASFCEYKVLTLIIIPLNFAVYSYLGKTNSVTLSLSVHVYVYVYRCMYWQPRAVSGAQRCHSTFGLSFLVERWPQPLKYQFLTPVSRAGGMGRGSVLWGSVYFILKKMLSRRLSLKCQWPKLCLGSIFSFKKEWESEYLAQGCGITCLAETSCNIFGAFRGHSILKISIRYLKKKEKIRIQRGCNRVAVRELTNSGISSATTCLKTFTTIGPQVHTSNY